MCLELLKQCEWWGVRVWLESARRLAAAEAPWGWRWGEGWRWGRRLWGLPTKGARREEPDCLAEVGVGSLPALRLLL